MYCRFLYFRNLLILCILRHLIDQILQMSNFANVTIKQSKLYIYTCTQISLRSFYFREQRKALKTCKIKRLRENQEFHSLILPVTVQTLAVSSAMSLVLSACLRSASWRRSVVLARRSSVLCSSAGIGSSSARRDWRRLFTYSSHHYVSPSVKLLVMGPGWKWARGGGEAMKERQCYKD